MGIVQEKSQIKQWIPRILLAVILLALSAYLLKGDVWTFWTWWLLAALLGVAAMPVTGILFGRFEDKGWIFSRVKMKSRNYGKPTEYLNHRWMRKQEKIFTHSGARQ